MVFTVKYLANDGQVRSYTVDTADEEEAISLTIEECSDGSDGGFFKLINVEY